MKKLYVIDASGYLYRSYFAIRGMTNDEGESTNALFGFIRSVLKLMKDFNPEHMVSVFDGPDCSKARKEMYADYKAHRQAMPGDLRYQIEWAREFCDLMGIPELNIPEVEADDAMGSVAKWGSKNGFHVFLCTSDKDMAQLVDNTVSMLQTHNDNLILDSKEVEKKYGVPPNKIIDLLSIVGDSSDNVPGLPGFGPKTAISLLQEMGTLDAILDAPDQVPGKKKQETIREEKDKALLSRKLVTINTEVEIPHEEYFYQLKDQDLEGLRKFYSSKKFNSLLKELEGEKEEPKEEKRDYHLIDSKEELDKLLETLGKQKEICFDTETTSEKPLLAELVGIGLGFKPGEAWYIPVNGSLGLDTVIKKLKPLFENEKIAFYAHNAKYDLHILKHCGIEVATLGFDTLLASYILNSHSRRHSLDALSLEYFNKVKIETSELIGKGKKAITMREVPIEKVSEYCCEDVDYTIRLKEKLKPQLKEREMERLYYDIELPLTLTLERMEERGIYLDVPVLEKMGVSIKKEVDSLVLKIYEMAGEEFNLNSPKQLGEILFQKLEIPSPKKGKQSTSADILETLAIDYPIAGLVLEYRQLAKLQSTYIETLPHQVNPKTGRIHPTFNQSVAATGRLSCQDPNLQNIPVRTEVGRKIREAFRPEKKGWSYLAADYSQIELRLLAHMSEDPTLVKAFEHGEDIHAHTAATVLDIPIEEVTKEQRFHAKAVNFGLMYGQGPFGLAKELGISTKEASAFIEKYFDRYSHVQEFIEKSKDLARLNGKAVTSTGRERLIPEILSKNVQIRLAAERLAVNTPLQGTAADLIKIAMLDVEKALIQNQFTGFMILQIHDELIFEMPDDELEAAEPVIRSAMQDCMQLKVPLVVDINIGKNWKEC